MKIPSQSNWTIGVILMEEAAPHLQATILTCPVKICDTLRSGQCAISKLPCKAWDIIIQETKTNFLLIIKTKRLRTRATPRQRGQFPHSRLFPIPTTFIKTSFFFSTKIQNSLCLFLSHIFLSLREAIDLLLLFGATQWKLD